MRAWLLPAFTGIGSIRLADAAEPVPGKGELLLGLGFAALNPADRFLAEGQYPARPAFPHILGRDGVGCVLALGEGVSGVAVGDTRLILRGEVGGHPTGHAGAARGRSRGLHRAGAAGLVAGASGRRAAGVRHRVAGAEPVGDGGGAGE